MHRRHALGLAAAAVIQPLASPAFAQRGWQPDRTITLVTGYAPGGSTDIAARLLTDRMAMALGPDVRIVVENRAGAAGQVASEWLKRQPADGHTLMITETGAAAAAPASLIGGTRYDPVADFIHLGVISTPPGVLVVTPGFGGASAQDVLATLRQAPPDAITYASSGFGGVLHLRGEMLGQTLGTRFVHVPYRSGAQMVVSIMTGEAQFGIAALASATPLMREGKLRGVALVGHRRFPLFPDIPTLAELGVPGFEDAGFFLLIGPAGIPQPAAEALNRAVQAALHDPTVRERLVFAGHDPVTGPNGLAEARAFMVRELAIMQGIVERTGIRVQP